MSELQLYNVDQTADLLGGISPWTVRKLYATGQLRPVRIGRRILFEKCELLRFIALRRATPQPSTTNIQETLENQNG